jgi:hypothetical protein
MRASSCVAIPLIALALSSSCHRQGSGQAGAAGAFGASGAAGSGVAGAGVAAGSAPSSSGAGEAGALIELKAVTQTGACAGERAAVPSSGAVTALLSQGADTSHQATSDYVAISAGNEYADIYFSFAPDLPAAFTTEQARAKLNYAYARVSQALPKVMGGSVQLLSSSQLLYLKDFERLEVVDGKLEWSLKQSAGPRFLKVLSIYDEDPTNDPAEDADCVSDDIIGECACGFLGPSISVVLQGSVVVPARKTESW